jgi:DNA-binding PadR family transcriptional regulator
VNEQNPLKLSATEESVLLTMLVRPRFGLEIRDVVSEASEGRCWIEFATLYPMLRKLKQRGLIQPSGSETEAEADSEEIFLIRGKHRRQYYAITELGENALLEAELIRQKLRGWEGSLETSI